MSYDWIGRFVHMFAWKAHSETQQPLANLWMDFEFCLDLLCCHTILIFLTFYRYTHYIKCNDFFILLCRLTLRLSRLCVCDICTKTMKMAFYFDINAQLIPFKLNDMLLQRWRQQWRDSRFIFLYFSLHVSFSSSVSRHNSQSWSLLSLTDWHKQTERYLFEFQLKCLTTQAIINALPFFTYSFNIIELFFVRAFMQFSWTCSISYEFSTKQRNYDKMETKNWANVW